MSSKPNLPPGVPEMIDGEKVLWAWAPTVGNWLLVTAKGRRFIGVHLANWPRWFPVKNSDEDREHLTAAAIAALLAELEAERAKRKEAEARIAVALETASRLCYEGYLDPSQRDEIRQDLGLEDRNDDNL